MRRRRSAWLLLRDAGVNALIVAQITIVHGYSSRVVRNTLARWMSLAEDKLNSLLSNQDAMAQVMQLAQSLSQSGAGAADGGARPCRAACRAERAAARRGVRKSRCSRSGSSGSAQSGAPSGNAMPSSGDLNAMLSQLTGGPGPT